MICSHSPNKDDNRRFLAVSPLLFQTFVTRFRTRLSGKTWE